MERLRRGKGGTASGSAICSALTFLLVSVASGVARSEKSETTTTRLVVFRIEAHGIPENTVAAIAAGIAAAFLHSGVEALDGTEEASAAPRFVGVPLRSTEKAEITRRLNAVGYVDGEATVVPEGICVALSRRDTLGNEVANRKIVVQTAQDFDIVFESMARALVQAPASAEDARNRNVAAAESSSEQGDRDRMKANFGGILGGMFGVDETMTSGALVGFEMRLDRDLLLVSIGMGIGVTEADKYRGGFTDAVYYDCDTPVGATCDNPSWSLLGEDQPKMQFWFGLDVGTYFSRTSVAPYAGAGLGMFFGGRVHRRSRVDTEGDGEEDATKYWSSTLGFDVHPTVGVEFLRHSRLRLHFEGRYACDIAQDGHFGHGPVVLAGVNF